MISIYSISKYRNEEKKDYITVELRGLSTDTKPTKINNKDIENGSVFIEIDTGVVFFFDLDSKTWKEI